MPAGRSAGSRNQSDYRTLFILPARGNVNSGVGGFDFCQHMDLRFLGQSIG